MVVAEWQSQWLTCFSAARLQLRPVSPAQSCFGFKCDKGHATELKVLGQLVQSLNSCLLAGSLTAVYTLHAFKVPGVHGMPLSLRTSTHFFLTPEPCAELHTFLLNSIAFQRSIGDHLPPAVPDLATPPLHNTHEGEAAHQVSFLKKDLDMHDMVVALGFFMPVGTKGQLHPVCSNRKPVPLNPQCTTQGPKQA